LFSQANDLGAAAPISREPLRLTRSETNWRLPY
jgi:hypothetical protein